MWYYSSIGSSETSEGKAVTTWVCTGRWGQFKKGLVAMVEELVFDLRAMADC